MDKKTTGIVATSVTALLCGCPGLFSLCFGAVMALAGMVPGAEIDIFGSNSSRAATATGLTALCLGIFFVAIPILVGIFTLRNKPEPQAFPDEPIPPAI